MTPEQIRRLDDICLIAKEFKHGLTRELLAVVDQLREELRRERIHDDNCPHDTKPCLCCPCTCPTRDELRQQARDAWAERDALRARVSELEACGRGRIIIQTPTPQEPAAKPRTYTAEQAERAFWVGWSGMSVADFRRALEEEDGK